MSQRRFPYWNDMTSEGVRAHAAKVLQHIATGNCDIVAVRHPLGFICFPIERHPWGGICIHAWHPALPGSRPTTSPVHAHSWDLVSFVLAGELRNNLVAVRPDTPTHRVYHVESGEHIDVIRATDQLVAPHHECSEQIGRDQRYEMSAGQFHETNADLAVTVALSAKQMGMFDVTLGRIDGQTHHVRRELCDRMETMKAAQTVMDQIIAMVP